MIKVDIEKLKKAPTWAIVDELNVLEEELYDRMHPISYARSKELSEYRLVLKEELVSRGVQV